MSGTRLHNDAIAERSGGVRLALAQVARKHVHAQLRLILFQQRLRFNQLGVQRVHASLFLGHLLIQRINARASLVGSALMLGLKRINLRLQIADGSITLLDFRCKLIHARLRVAQRLFQLGNTVCRSFKLRLLL